MLEKDLMIADSFLEIWILVVSQCPVCWFLSSFVCIDGSQCSLARLLCYCAPWWFVPVAFGEGSATVSGVLRFWSP